MKGVAPIKGIPLPWAQKDRSASIAKPFPLYSIVFAGLFLVLSAIPLFAATYYVAPNGKNDNPGTEVSPWKTLSHASSKIAGGDTLIVKNGTYTGEENQIWNLPSGQEARYTTIKAEHPFGVILEGTGKDVGQNGYLRTPIRLLDNAYIQIEGFKLRNSPTGGAILLANSHHIKLLRISIKNGTRFDYPWGPPLTITKGSHHVLAEDVWITGAMRYGVLVSGNNKHGSDKEEDTTRQIILRRVVVRWDYMKTDEPKAGIAFYGADDFSKNGAVVDSVCQNCLVLDLNPGDDYENMYGAYYNPKTTQNIGYYGSIALNIKGETEQSVIGGFYVTDNYKKNKGQKIVDSVAWDIDGPAVQFTEGDPTGFGEVTQSTLGKSEYGVFVRGSPGGSRLPVKIKNNLFIKNETVYSSVKDLIKLSSYNLYFPQSSLRDPNQALTSDPQLKYLVQVEQGSPAYHSGEGGASRGATLLYRYGKSGTLWGEPGWDALTTESLWPWPYEDQIHTDFSEPNPPPKGAYPPKNKTDRGFAAKGQTLTKYIWEYLGHPIPKWVYATGSQGSSSSAPAVPPPPSLPPPSSSRDKVPPSAPSGLRATAVGNTQIDLVWVAATDNVAVTGYQIQRCPKANCTGFTPIATTTTTSYSNTGLLTKTTYRYRVQAIDAAGNHGNTSNIVAATTSTLTQDTSPPTMPARLTATASSPTQIDLTWTASTDNVGVTGYQVQRCYRANCVNFAPLTTTTITRYSNTGLTAKTAYRYRVRAMDAAGGRSRYSNVAMATTLAQPLPDTRAPSMPKLTAAVIGETQIDLTWIAATDNVGVTGYQVERCMQTGCTGFALIATTTITRYSNTGLAAQTTYRYRVRAMDAAGNRSNPSNIATAITASSPLPPPLPSDPLEEALRTGNALLVGNSGIILDAALDAIEQNKAKFNAAKRQLFNLSASGSAHANGASLTAINWHPTHDAAFLTSTFGVNESVLFTNSVFESGHTIYQKPLAIIGEKAAGTGPVSRYMVMGSNPMRNAYRVPDGSAVNSQMHQLMQNGISWLTGRSDLGTTPWNVVIAQTDDSFFFPDDRAIRTWLDQKYGGKAIYNPKDACNGARLSRCITANTRLLIISQVMNVGEDATGITAAVKEAMERGIPVLYMHHNGDKKELGAALLPLFDVGYEDDAYRFKLRLTNYDGSKTYNTLPADVKSIQTLLTHFKNQSFTIRLNACNEDACSNDTAYHREFQDGAGRVQSMVNHYDQAKINIFAGNDSKDLRFQKLLVLLADHYRQTVAYPMDSATTVTPDQTMAFLKSLFADHVVYHSRMVNPAQPDMGNFSRSNFRHITPVTKTVRLTSKQNFRAAGVYALPGQTFKVTRMDNSSVKTSVFINTLREGATHLFEARNGSADKGYNRPKYLQSVPFDIKRGETLFLTSPYGGPIQIGFDTHDQSVEFRFEGVGEHPFWDGPEDDFTFDRQLARGDYDWAEFSTPHFEVHSTLLKMRESLQNPNWNTGTKLAAAITRYIHNLPHVLAGLQGPGIDVVPEIHDFALQKGWQIDSINKVKHMNADQATCGYGCSGNPYDAYWAFSPTQHGDIHELGHGLEKDRLRFDGWDLHASTNPYSYYSKTQFYKTTGADPNCQTLPFKAMFNTLQASTHQADPFSYMKNAKLTDWSNGVGITIQMMMSAQAQGVLQDGWHLLARLHLMEREFERARKDQATWEARRVGLGFGNYSFDAIRAINNNDWLVNALSFVTGLDYRAYLTMWGLGFSNEAGAQVASFGYPVVPRKYYVSDGKDYCKGLDKPVVNINGTSPWPLP